MSPIHPWQLQLVSTAFCGTRSRAAPQLQIVIIGGTRDSAASINLPSALLAEGAYISSDRCPDARGSSI